MKILTEEEFRAKLVKRTEMAKAAKARSFQKRVNRMKSSTEYRMRDALTEIRFSNKSGSHVGCFRGAPGAETDKHLDMKYQVWKQLKKWGHEVITEAIFNNGKRADVIDLTNCIVYEILWSETEEKLAEKTLAYPAIFEIRKVDATKQFDEKMLQ